ncbi:MAG: CDP-alcohol phosphatidyltransferase family protein [Spirochaetota bacterium]|nr:CDP-alcohol phosphatidyltransferase family protein [Spirochaetota bacterium]
MLESEILQSLLPLIMLNGIVILCLIVFAFLYPHRNRNPEILERMHKSFIGIFLREFWYWFTSPLISLFQILHLSPNMVTGISLILASFAGYYYYLGNFAIAGWMLIISATLDILDGRLARITDQVSQEGAFLDSCIDRYCDGIIFLGLALYFRGNLLVLTATIATLIGSEIVSYARAKGESVGINKHQGLMQRAERIVLLSVISVFHPFLMIILSKYGIRTNYPIIIIIILMAFLTNYTAIVRIVTIFKSIKNLKCNEG